ncbi:MAG: hypothetical protein JSR77_00200 [Planctomycetes bacterium]|nr:hypothetical protein [Planctomycetota bacterium]
MDVGVQSEVALVFAPPHDQIDLILDQLTDHQSTLRDVAHHHRVTLSALVSWLDRPDIKARFDALAQASIAHTRLVATRYLPQALRVNAAILAAFLNQRIAAPQPSTEATSNQVSRPTTAALDGATAPIGVSKTPPPRQSQSAAKPLERPSAEMAQRAATFILRAARLPNWSTLIRANANTYQRRAPQAPRRPSPALASLVQLALSRFQSLSTAAAPTQTAPATPTPTAPAQPRQELPVEVAPSNVVEESDPTSPVPANHTHQPSPRRIPGRAAPDHASVRPQGHAYISPNGRCSRRPQLHDRADTRRSDAQPPTRQRPAWLSKSARRQHSWTSPAPPERP